MRLMLSIIVFCSMLFVFTFTSFLMIGLWQTLHQWGIV